MVDIAVVGAGRIGLPVARRLVTAGHSVRIHDIRAQLEPTVRGIGATWGPPSTGTDVLLTVLPGSPELQSLMLTDTGLLTSLRPGTVWLDLTSASPALGAELASAAHDRGIDYLEAPVGGGPDAAEAGELTLYVGGERATFDRHQPILRSFAAQLHYTGPHGSGYLTKLLVNLLWFNQAVAVGEVLLLAQSGGLDLSRLRETLLTGPASSTFLSDVVPDLLAGDRMPHFGLDRIVEELNSLRDLAHHNHIPVPMTEAVAAVHREALARFGPVDGELLAVSHLEQLSGRSLGHCQE
ncbi:NAD(P)-dependent oxidoreductase [Kribbella swartbergensis]